MDPRNPPENWPLGARVLIAAQQVGADWSEIVRAYRHDKKHPAWERMLELAAAVDRAALAATEAE